MARLSYLLIGPYLWALVLRQLPKRLLEAVVGDLEVVSRLHFYECRAGVDG